VNPLTYLDDLVARAIMGLHSLLSHVFPANSGWAWGLSIVILVMIIRALLVPLFVKQIHAQRKMAQHQPQLQELRKKYKNDKQKLQEEQMKFFKENGVNPLAGCLPMIPQMIIFICLFSVLRAVTDWKPGSKTAYGLTEAAVESARQATIFGVHLGDKLLFPHTLSLGIRGSIIIVLSVAISASTTFMTVRQTSKRGLMQSPGVDPDNPMAASQKYMQYIVPFFSLTGLYWQYGLVLYWVTTNVWTVCQQFIMFRNWTPPVPVGDGPAAATAGGSSSARSASRSTTTTRSTKSTATRTGTASGTGAARTGTARAGTTRTGSAARTGSSGTRPATGTKSSGTAKQSGTMSSQVASNGAENGSEKRPRLRLGKSKPEPEPIDDVPVQKVVRQQPTRQSRSKRSGNR
jgi:YidC/Oxa1 family membrane protein insertase